MHPHFGMVRKGESVLMSSLGYLAGIDIIKWFSADE